MKLAKKTFIYSMVIAFTAGSIFLTYFIFLFPSMYIDYKSEKNRNNAIDSHLDFVETSSYDSSGSDNKMSSAGIIIPNIGDTIYVSSSFFEGSITLNSDEAKELLTRFKKLSAKAYSGDGERNSGDLSEEYEDMLGDFANVIKGNFAFLEHIATFDFRYKAAESVSFDTFDKMHSLGDGSFMGEFIARNTETKTDYTNYVGISKTDDKLFISMSSIINPASSDILPVVIGAVPVILPLILLFAFAISALFSRSLVAPITKLARDADKRRHSGGITLPPIEVHGNDEISDLAKSLNMLYTRQEDAMMRIKEEGERKAVFLRASSHKLKTPIAAGTLLIDGMISNVGKFSDREKYLPEVKNQLVTMRDIVDEILKIDKIPENIETAAIDIGSLIRAVFDAHRINADAKQIGFHCEGTAVWNSDINILGQIMDNLIKNAVDHSPEGSQVNVYVSYDSISVENMPASIPPNMLPNLFEPFVTGGGKGHGLGLYVAKYFAELLHMQIKVSSENDKVTFTLNRNTEGNKEYA